MLQCLQTSKNMLEEIDKIYQTFCTQNHYTHKHFIQFIKLESPQYISFNDFFIAKQNNSRLLIIIKNNQTDNYFIDVTQPVYLTDMDIIKTIQHNEALKDTISSLEKILKNLSDGVVKNNIVFKISANTFSSIGIDYYSNNVKIKLNIDATVYSNDLLFILNFILLKEQYSNNSDALKLQIIKFLILLKNRQKDLIEYIKLKLNPGQLDLSIDKNNFFKTYAKLILEFYPLM